MTVAQARARLQGRRPNISDLNDCRAILLLALRERAVERARKYRTNHQVPAGFLDHLEQSDQGELVKLLRCRVPMLLVTSPMPRRKTKLFRELLEFAKPDE